MYTLLAFPDQLQGVQTNAPSPSSAYVKLVILALLMEQQANPITTATTRTRFITRTPPSWPPLHTARPTPLQPLFLPLSGHFVQTIPLGAHLPSAQGLSTPYSTFPIWLRLCDYLLEHRGPRQPTPSAGVPLIYPRATPSHGCRTTPSPLFAHHMPTNCASRHAQNTALSPDRHANQDPQARLADLECYPLL